MTTYITFNQPPNQPFQFALTLDGGSYSASVPWSLFGQRYYFLLKTLDGSTVLNIPRIGSPLNYDINLIAGYFTTSSVVWREDSNQFEINP